MGDWKKGRGRGRGKVGEIAKRSQAHPGEGKRFLRLNGRTTANANKARKEERD